MEWLVIVVVGALLVGAAVAVAVALVAGRNDQARLIEERERSAVWEAGYGDRDLRVLAGLAASAHAKLRSGEVQIVLTHAGGSGDGVIVTGRRIAPSRLGSRVRLGEGLAGRGLEHTRTTRTWEGVAVPIPSGDRVVGVVAVSAPAGPLRDRDVARLEELAADAGSKLGPRDGMSGHTPQSWRDAG